MKDVDVYALSLLGKYNYYLGDNFRRLPFG